MRTLLTMCAGEWQWIKTSYRSRVKMFMEWQWLIQQTDDINPYCLLQKWSFKWKTPYYLRIPCLLSCCMHIHFTLSVPSFYKTTKILHFVLRWNENKFQNQSRNKRFVSQIALGLRDQYIVSYIMCLEVKGKLYRLEKEVENLRQRLLSFITA